MEPLIKKYELSKLNETIIRKKGYRFSVNLKDARKAVRRAAQDIADFSSVVLNRKNSKIASKIDPIISKYRIQTFLLSLHVTRFREGNSTRSLSADETNNILKFFK